MVSRRRRFSRWWRRGGMTLRLFVSMLALALIVALMLSVRSGDQPGSSSLVFALVLFNVVILCVLGFLIARNVVKLVFDRRRAILGSRLRTKLVLAFGGLALLPLVLVFFFASGLLTRAMEGWFSSQVEIAVGGAVEVGQIYFSSVRDTVGNEARRIAPRIEALGSTEEVEKLLTTERQESRMFSLALATDRATVLVRADSPVSEIQELAPPPITERAIRQAFEGGGMVAPESVDTNEFLRAYWPVTFQGRKHVLVVTARVSPDITRALDTVKDSLQDYRELQLNRSPLRSGYLLTLAMITALIMFAAVWFAFYLARELVIPIQRLAEGTRAVARGNLDYQVRGATDDEIGVLVKSFNQMTKDLRTSRMEAEDRRAHLETVLEHLAVGVVALDDEGKVTTYNEPAAAILSWQPAPSHLGLKFEEIIPIEIYKDMEPFMKVAPDTSGVTVLERETKVRSQGRDLKVLITGGPIRDQRGAPLGTILLFDDITDLASAQQMAAWREVARRVAHEIKNPLTPIQLSAQRFGRLVEHKELPEQLRIVSREIVQTIVSQVDSIKRLADEFSRFSRMPTAILTKTSPKDLVQEMLSTFSERFDRISFQSIVDPQIPELLVDREQIRRALFNLVENAAQSLDKDSAPPNGESQRVVVRALLDKRRSTVTIEVSDNGPGIPDADKGRIFDPYFTTKSEGTGLGLAIVTSIVQEHQGTIRVYDNPPRGARFVVELPLQQRPATTQRKITSRVA